MYVHTWPLKGNLPHCALVDYWELQALYRIVGLSRVFPQEKFLVLKINDAIIKFVFVATTVLPPNLGSLPQVLAK